MNDASNASNGARTSAGTTFREDEVRAVDELLRILARGGDARVIARSAPLKSVRAKFARMVEALRGAK